jgi:hypothetical protein
MGATNETGVGVEGMVVVPMETDASYPTCGSQQPRGQKKTTIMAASRQESSADHQHR